MDGLSRSLHKIGLVKKVRKVKRGGVFGPKKKGRPRKSMHESRIATFIEIDWTLVEIVARERDEWQRVTLGIESYNLDESKTRIFATDSATST